MVWRFITNLIKDFGKPKQKDMDAFVSWARENAIMINQFDGLTFDIEKLSFLDKLLENKRIVYLGEEDHWIHEKTDYRILMLRYLCSRGWRHIGEELGWSDGIRMNRFLQTGEESILERIATYGYKGDIRADRNDAATGILKDNEGNYPVNEFKSEQLRLAKALRDINKNIADESGKLHYFGFDIDYLAGGGYEDIAEILSPFKNRSIIAEILSLLSRVPLETREQEINRLSNVLRTIGIHQGNIKEILGEKQYMQLQEGVLSLRDSFQFRHVSDPATNYKALSVAMATREESMHRRFKYIFSQIGYEGKIVLMAHNRHLSKNFGSIKNANGGSPGGGRVPSIGTFVNRLLPGQVFSVWEMHDHGQSSQPYASFSQKYISIPGSLNAILAGIGSAFILPTSTNDKRAYLFKREIDIAGIYNIVYRTKIAEQADAIFFMNMVSPLKTHVYLGGGVNHE